MEKERKIIDCPRCNGTGIFKGSRENSRCNHCIGVGKVRWPVE